MKNNKHLKVLGNKEEPLIQDLEGARYTPEEKEVAKAGLLDDKPITPPMKRDRLLEPGREPTIPEAHPPYRINKNRKTDYLGRLAESVG